MMQVVRDMLLILFGLYMGFLWWRIGSQSRR